MVREPDPTRSDGRPASRRHATERIEPAYVVEPTARDPVDPPETRVDPGSEVIGNYVLLGELGRGGMGVVYRAHDRVLNRNVALKMIADTGRAGGKLLKRFRTEASALARLHDPRIVPVFEVGEHEGKPYIVMELVEGTSLDALLRDDEIALRDRVKIVLEVALALEHAHQNGIVHRDVKPENVIVDRSGLPHLMDFGLAIDESAAERLTVPGAVLGTPAYMSPEQAAGGTVPVTSASDIYSLGAVLYRALVGKPPFSGAGTHNILYKVITADPTPPRRIDPKLHPDLETIALRCLMKEPERRYASAREVADELRRFLDGEPIVARPQSALEKSWRRVRRHPQLIAALFVFFAIACGGGYALEEHHREDLERAAAELRLSDARTTLELAKRLVAENKYTRAIEVATRAIELAPEVPAAWAVRAGARFSTSDRDGAIADATHAIELAPATYDAWYVRASARSNKHEIAEAIADATHAIELDPRDGRAFHVRAAARFNSGDEPGAIDDATRAIELAPRNAEGWMIRATARSNRGDYDGAIEDATKAIELAPSEVHAWHARAAARAMKGDCAAAIEDATRAIALAPELAETWIVRAIAHARLGEDKDAAEDATKTIQLAPTNAQAWILRAHSRLNLGDREGAKPDFERYLELEPHGKSSEDARQQLTELGADRPR
jgi:serine/threonine protein kinase/regulator of sirC expression with transglutaminase-like and TPR domain